MFDQPSGRKPAVILAFVLCVILLIGLKGSFAKDQEGGSAGSKIVVRKNVNYELLSFDTLADFSYPLPKVTIDGDKVSTQIPTQSLIPANVKALNGKKIAIRGFVLPLEPVEAGKPSFLLVDQIVTCMFCQGIKMNEWIEVMQPESQKFKIKVDDLEEPFVVYGELEVGERYEHGRLVSLYRLAADGVETEKKKFLGLF